MIDKHVDQNRRKLIYVINLRIMLEGSNKSKNVIFKLNLVSARKNFFSLHNLFIKKLILDLYLTIKDFFS